MHMLTFRGLLGGGRESFGSRVFAVRGYCFIGDRKFVKGFHQQIWWEFDIHH